MSIVKFNRTIGESEKNACYLNLTDDEGNSYGSRFPESGTRLWIITEGRRYKAVKNGDNQIWGGLRIWYTRENVCAGDTIHVEYDPLIGEVDGRVPLRVSVVNKVHMNVTDSESTMKPENHNGLSCAESKSEVTNDNQFFDDESILPDNPTDESTSLRDRRSYSDFLCMPKEEIAASIVEVLETRPNHSCKIDDIAQHALRYLGVRTRGGPRRKCEKLLHRTLTKLKQRQIVEEYRTSRNRRIRLTKEYKDRFERYKVRCERHTVLTQESEADEKTDRVIPSMGEDFFDEVSLPELPDDDTNALDVLTGVGVSTIKPSGTPDSFKGTPRRSQESYDVLQTLSEAFVGKEEIEAEMSFRKLTLSISLTPTIRGRLSVRYFGAGNNSIIIKSALPFSHSAIRDLLVQFGEPGYEGCLCIENHNGVSCLFIKEELELCRYSETEVVSVVGQIIQQSRESARIIEEHSCDL